MKKQFHRAKASFASEFEFNGKNERLEFDDKHCETLGRMVSTDDLNSQKECFSPSPFFNRRLAAKNLEKPIFPYVARRRPSLTSPGTQQQTKPGATRGSEMGATAEFAHLLRSQS